MGVRTGAHHGGAQRLVAGHHVVQRGPQHVDVQLAGEAAGVHDVVFRTERSGLVTLVEHAEELLVERQWRAARQIVRGRLRGGAHGPASLLRDTTVLNRIRAANRAGRESYRDTTVKLDRL